MSTICSMLTALTNYDVIITCGATRATNCISRASHKLTSNIVYSVNLSVYQHRADIEPTTFGMFAQCSANGSTGKFGSSMNPSTSFDINIILYVVIIFTWCICSGENYVCDQTVIFFSLTSRGINSVRVPHVVLSGHTQKNQS